jgi:hypothetical protein
VGKIPTAPVTYHWRVDEQKSDRADQCCGAGAIIMIQFSAPAHCYRLGILKSSDKSILLVSSVDYASTRTLPNTATGRSMKILTHKISYSI